MTVFSRPSKPEIGAHCNGCGVCCSAQVCIAGSYALHLVKVWGERAPGPCPALERDGDKLVCGVMMRPNDWLTVLRRPTALREAFGLLIGVGVGCDELSEKEQASEQSRDNLDALHAAYLAAHTLKELEAAVDMIRGPLGLSHKSKSSFRSIL